MLLRGDAVATKVRFFYYNVLKSRGLQAIKMPFIKSTAMKDRPTYG